MKKADKLFLLLLLLGFVLLIFSTKIVLLVTGKNLEKKQIDTSDLSLDLKYEVDRIFEPEGLLKEIYIRGWVFNPSYQKNGKRYATIVFKADDFAYEFPAEMDTREDVTRHFSEYGLSQNDLGFNCIFSLIAMEDGVYEMLIKAWEEGGTPEMISTKRFFQVDKATFKEVTDEIEHSVNLENCLSSELLPRKQYAR